VACTAIQYFSIFSFKQNDFQENKHTDNFALTLQQTP